MSDPPRPQPYVCPAARMQSQAAPRGSQNGGAYHTPLLPLRLQGWSNPITPYPQQLPRQPDPLTSPTSLNDRRRDTVANMFTQTLSAASGHRPLTWQNVASLPGGSSRAPEERHQARTWEGNPVADAAEGTWSADVESEWWRPAAERSDANTPRPTEEQIQNQHSVNSGNSYLPSPAETSWSSPPNSGMSLRRASVNSGWTDRVQPGSSNLANAQTITVEDRRVPLNTSSYASGSQSATTSSLPTIATNTRSDNDPNNEGPGWFDWVGSYVNTAQNVLERVNSLNSARPAVSQPAIHSRPMIHWSPPQMQPLANDPDVHGQIHPPPLLRNNAPPQFGPLRPPVAIPIASSPQPYPPQDYIRQRQHENQLEIERERARIDRVFGNATANAPQPP